MRTKKDSTQKDIVEALKACHIDVLDLSDVPANVPHLAGLTDIVAGGYHQEYQIPMTILIEIKTEDGDLRPKQDDLQRWWRGAIACVKTPAEALALFGIEL